MEMPEPANPVLTVSEEVLRRHPPTHPLLVADVFMKVVGWLLSSFEIRLRP